MIEYDLEVVETLVDDYSGQALSTYEGTTMGWTIVRNSDGQTRHVNELTKGALNVLAEAFDGLASMGGREAAYRSAVATIQSMIESEVRQAEEDDSSALLLAQQADVIAAEAEINEARNNEARFSNFTLEEEAFALAEASAPTDVVERIAEYTSSDYPTFTPGDAVRITAPGHSQIDGKTGTVFSKCSADSEFDYLVTADDGNSTIGRTIVVYSYELTPLV